MKETYETPVMEIIEIDAEDIICASDEAVGDCSSDCSFDCDSE